MEIRQRASRDVTPHGTATDRNINMISTVLRKLAGYQTVHECILIAITLLLIYFQCRDVNADSGTDLR